MSETQKNRMAVVSPEAVVPSAEELEKHFKDFWSRMRLNLRPPGHKRALGYEEGRIVKRLAEDAHYRRIREAGLGSVRREVLPAVFRLAREGGRLVGPTNADEVHRLAASLHAESGWMRDVSSWIMAHMLRDVARGGHGLALPPVILAGPPGIGKSHYASALGRLVGAPVRMIDVGGGSAGFRISGTEKGWSSAQPGIPVESVLAHRVANPVIVVDEIDKSGTMRSTRGSSTSLATSLLQMLEPGTARHFECPYYRLPFDLSRVVWIMTANDVSAIPEPLRDRSRVFVLPPISSADAVEHFDRLTGTCDDAAAQERCRDFIERMAGRSEGISLRQIRQLADAVTAPIPQPMH